MFEVGDSVRANSKYNEGSLEGSEGVIVSVFNGQPFPYLVDFHGFMEHMKESEIDNV